MAERVRVGLIGCGAISVAYLKMARNLPILDISACADLDGEKAGARAEEFGIPRVLGVDELIADPDSGVVLNLASPKAHASVALAALEAGERTFSEKPLGIRREEGAGVLRTGAARGLRVGCAPDTVLGAGIQTARKAIDDGMIGRPIGFTAHMLSRGVETWHPNPRFYYEVGGGPMFDMGPYYLTALLNLLGPIRRISALTSIAIPVRHITSQPFAGQDVEVETPDHLCGSIEFRDGAIGTLMTSFATAHGVYDRKMPIVVYGAEGTLKVPDPNGFDGPVQVRGLKDEDWIDVPHAFPTGYGRAVGLADLCHAVRSGRKHRCSAEQAFAVLDAMQAFLESSDGGRAISLESSYERPEPMAVGLPFGQLDD